MADEKHLAILRRGVKTWNAWREDSVHVRPNLDGADLRGAELRRARFNGAHLNGADLGRANLRWADLDEACLNKARFEGADLSRAELRGAELREADIRGAYLWGADLGRADLASADLRGASLTQASLIDACLDGADLTGAKLWETQRGGWSIKGIICRMAFWDRHGKEPTEYADGEFERLFTEKPRVILRYPGGLSPVDLAMLPLIVERLQAEHPGCVLHIRSLQDEGGVASVTITVEDLQGRDPGTFKAEVETLRGTLVAIQDRLRSEESLRLAFEAKYQAVVRDVLPMLLREAFPRHEVHIGHITGPTVIEGIAMSRDTFNVSGQAGAVGPGAHAHDNTFQQVQAGGIDLPKLAEELGRLRAALRQKDDPEVDEAVGEVAKAQKAAAKSDGPAALQHLKAAGKWTLTVAEKVGVPLAVEAMKRALL